MSGGSSKSIVEVGRPFLGIFPESLLLCTGGKRKRRAGGGFDDRLSDDSDFDDLRHIGGLAAGMRSASAKSVRSLFCCFLKMLAWPLTRRILAVSVPGPGCVVCVTIHWKVCVSHHIASPNPEAAAATGSGHQ